jgi:hypothetical protein
VDAGSILGLSAVRPPFLDHLPAAQAREYQTPCNRNVMTIHPFSLDDIDEDVDDDDGFYEEEEGDEDEDDDEDEDEDVETWQVAFLRFCR